MEKFKRSAFLIVMGTAILLFMSGCGLKKRAAVMSGETLTKKTEASATKTVGVPPGLGFQPGLPPQPSLRGFPKVGDSGEGKMVASVPPEQPSLPNVFPEGDRGPASGFSPGPPPQPRELPEKTMASDETGIASEAPLEPLEMTSVTEDFLPELPPQPNPAEVKAEALGAPSGEGRSATPANRISIIPKPTLPQEERLVEKKVESEKIEPEKVESQKEEPREALADAPGQELSREGTMMAEAEKFAQEGKLQGNGSAMVLLDEFFEFDSWRLTDEAKRALEANAKWFKANPNQNIIIEGHCDERGTESYNFELGMKRANVTRNFLLDLGVDSSRIKTVSYGELKPFCVDRDEDCYQKNRRAHFVVAS